MKKSLFYLSFLIASISMFSQGSITLKTPQTTGGTQIACQSISLQPGFSFSASGTNSLTLKADPSVCDPYGGTTGGFSANQNYILTRTYTKEDGSRYLDQVQYFDGLGRPVQTVQRGITPLAADLISIQEYDAFGRESNAWLPTAISGNNGAYVNPATVKTQAIATNGGDQKPYSMPVYEASPLNRVLKQFGPGADWHNADNGTGKAVLTDYKTNVSGDASLNCIQYKAGETNQSPSLSKSGNYGTGELFVTQIKDEDGSISYEFKDKLGQVVLTRQINDNINHDTYYVYNDFGNLCYVLPPRINDEGTTQVNLEELAYLYKYDHRNRCIAKKLPGCEWIYYVYDKADRLIFTQDGEQRLKGEWTFNKYDVFGRVVITGLHTIAGKTHDQLRALVESQLVTEKYLLNSHWSYTWNSLTSLLTSTNYKQVLQVNYYDNYEFRKRPEYVASKFNFTNAGTEYNKRYGTDAGVIEQKGQLTGTATARLDGQNKFDYSVLYYDDRKQLIQTKNTNHLDGTEEEYIAYNFTGQAEKKLHIHIKDAQGGGKQEELYTYTYDHAGRLLSTKHKWNTGAEVTLAENSYDELGRLKTNKKGGQAYLNTTYGYNIRSWTNKIYSHNLEQDLSYNYNGNISSFNWRMNDQRRSYAYTYDNLSRLKTAAYTGIGSEQYSTEYGYDKHGNIMNLKRYGKKDASSYGEVDNLTMTYNGNQLAKVSDGVPNFAYIESADFKNYGGTNSAYAYNKNGAMSTDSHKGITKIQYNSLNLPYELLIKNTDVSGKIYYTYSASGVKLKTKHLKAKNLGYTPVTGPEDDNNFDVIGNTDYVGNMIYEDGLLKRILVDGGYIESSTYHYYLTDHLGNNRMTVNQNGVKTQWNHYYPFGMAFADKFDNGSKQPYKYNGKELDQMHGLNLYDYSARYYEPAIGRFTTVDPLAEKYYSISPYAYCNNNPIKFVDQDGRTFTDSAEVHVQELERATAAKLRMNEMMLRYHYDRIAKYGRMFSGMSEFAIKNLQQENGALEMIGYEINVLRNSNQIYDVKTDNSLSTATELIAGAQFNFSNNNFDILMPSGGGLGLFSHELKHAYQFEIGSFSTGHARNGLPFYDKQDELEAYKRGAIFGGDKYKSIQELPTTYNSLQEGPANQRTTSMDKMIPAGRQRIANITKSAFRVNKVTYIGKF